MLDQQNDALRVMLRVLKDSLLHSAAMFLVEKVGCGDVLSNAPTNIFSNFAACLTNICSGVFACPLYDDAAFYFRARPQPRKNFLNNYTRQFAFVTTKYPMSQLDKGKRSSPNVHFVANLANIR